MQDIFRAAESKEFTRLDSYHLYGPKFTKFTDSSPECLDADAARTGEHVGLAALKNLRMQAKSLKMDLFDEVAVATFILDYEFAGAGENIRRRDRATLVFVLDGGGWKIAHEHLSAIKS